MQEFISQPWPWYFSGFMIALIMFALLFFGKTFGFSSNLRTICAMSGAGKASDFFQFDWKKQTWNLLFLMGSVIGGFIAHTFMNNEQPVAISDDTIADLKTLGFKVQKGLQPDEIFNSFTLKSVLSLITGGLIVGFGSRWAGGCTSGHAISGLSNLQLPSLIAVIGFFIGGLIMTHLLFPIIFNTPGAL